MNTKNPGSSRVLAEADLVKSNPVPIVKHWIENTVGPVLTR